MKTFMEEVKDLMIRIIVFEGVEPDNLWFRSPENISENTNVYFLRYVEGGETIVMETANGWISLNEWLEPQGCFLEKYEYMVPTSGTDGVVYREKLFEGTFIDACKYLLFRKRKRGLARRPRRKKV